MASFDAERYLRDLGEQQLADEGPAFAAFASRLDHAAAALVAVGAITADDATAVLAHYREAPAEAVSSFLVSCRVAALNAEVPLPCGTLRLSHARLSENETAIVASYRQDPQAPSTHNDWIRLPSGWPSGLQPLVLTDDRGASSTLTFHGWGNDSRWQATLSAIATLAPDTAWLDLCDMRIRCIDDHPQVGIAIEPAPGGENRTY